MSDPHNSALRIFISHASPEQKLAEAWKELIDRLPLAAEAWYSTDRDPTGGVDAGRWRDQLQERIESSNVVLALFSPESLERPWIFFEAAYALGLGGDRLVIPVVYGVEISRLPGPLAEEQAYRGDNRDDIAELSQRFWARLYGGTPPDDLMSSWRRHVDDYLEHVNAYMEERVSHALFHGDFHAATVAKRLAGRWYARWTVVDAADGSEEDWLLQTLDVEPTETRIRMLGHAPNTALSPFEGIVSAEGQIAMSYWVQHDAAHCGTVLLRRVGALFEGTWEGFTAKTIEEPLSYRRGRVLMARDESVAATREIQAEWAHHW